MHYLPFLWGIEAASAALLKKFTVGDNAPAEMIKLQKEYQEAVGTLAKIAEVHYRLEFK